MQMLFYCPVVTTTVRELEVFNIDILCSLGEDAPPQNSVTTHSLDI